eukprot:GILK01000603.1.p1 GENE.GILK01000603.1~~GILK01000603.1.p1  ORF type:complete len:268 (+),score=49.93 GILK01000603.1:49-804(+)
MSSFFLLSLLVLSCFSCCVLAEKKPARDEGAPYPANHFPDGLESVQTSSVFPEVTFDVQSAGDAVLLQGEFMKVLVGFGNYGPAPLNVTAFTGAFLSIVQPDEEDVYIQNFTQTVFSEPVSVQPNEHVTLTYQFKSDRFLEPKKYKTILRVFYEDGEEYYSSVFHNGTVTLIERVEEWTVKGFMSSIVMFAILGTLGYIGFSASPLKNMVKAKTRKAYSSKPAAAAPVSAPSADDWLSHLGSGKGKKSKRT